MDMMVRCFNVYHWLWNNFLLNSVIVLFSRLLYNILYSNVSFSFLLNHFVERTWWCCFWWVNTQNIIFISLYISWISQSGKMPSSVPMSSVDKCMSNAIFHIICIPGNCNFLSYRCYGRYGYDNLPLNFI